MPAEYYLDCIRVVFQEHLLPRGLWDVRGERVDPARDHGTALLTIEGELDDISGLGQTHAAHELCSGIPEAEQAPPDRRRAPATTASSAAGAGATQVYPQVRDFIARHAAKADTAG